MGLLLSIGEAKPRPKKARKAYQRVYYNNINWIRLTTYRGNIKH